MVSAAMRYLLAAVALFLLTQNGATAQGNPQTIAFTAGVETPCDNGVRYGYWGNVTGQPVFIESVRLRQRLMGVETPIGSGRRTIVLATADLTGTIWINHPEHETAPRQLLKASWGPDAEPRAEHSTLVDLNGQVVLQHGEWLTLQTHCALTSGQDVTHDATVFLTLVTP